MSIFLRFWRFLTFVATVFAVRFFVSSWLLSLLSGVAVWNVLVAVAIIAAKVQLQRNFQKHAEPFRRLYGPYGQKVLAFAEREGLARKRLAGVFSKRRSVVEEQVAELQLFQDLSRAGLRVQGSLAEVDELALAYGKHRLAQDGF